MRLRSSSDYIITTGCAVLIFPSFLSLASPSEYLQDSWRLKTMSWSVVTNKAFLSLNVEDKNQLLKDLNNKRVVTTTDKTSKKPGNTFYDINMFNKDSVRLHNALGAFKGLCTVLAFHFETDRVLSKFIKINKGRKQTTRSIDTAALFVSTSRFVFFPLVFVVTC